MTPGPVIGELMQSIAFDPGDNLYAVSSSLGLVRIDVGTGQLTTIGGDLASPSNAFKPIVFDEDGTLFAVTDRLVVVDPATGAAAPLGSALGNYSIVGLAAISIPEPGSASLLVPVGIVIVLSRWRGLT